MSDYITETIPMEIDLIVKEFNSFLQLKTQVSLKERSHCETLRGGRCSRKTMVEK